MSLETRLQNALSNPIVLWLIAGTGALLLVFVLWRNGRAWGTALTRRLAPAVARVRDWVKRRYVWIFIGLAILLAGPFWLSYLGELRDLIAKLFDLVDNTNDADDLRSFAYALGAMLTAIAILAAAPFQLIKTWLNERQTITAETVMFTTRFTQAVEQLGAEKTEKQTETFRVRSIEYDMPAGDQSHRVEFQHREGDPFTIPKDVEDVDYGEWQTVTSTIEKTVPNLEVRLGAIYALERIAQDSERDHITVMETLCAYLRENAPASSAKDHDLGDWPAYPQNAADEGHEARTAELDARIKKLDEWVRNLPSPRVDIQAALTVIGRRSDERIRHEWQQERPFALDLRRTNLQNAYLYLAKLDNALLNHTRMEGADLRQARMERANLRQARMEGADLSLARMERANLGLARMERANLGLARMERANLFQARMEGAHLGEARMEGAHLGEARMEGAYLTQARMERAYLIEARMERANLGLARMERANLRQARMEGADLTWTRMERAILSEARMERADLHSADLRSASLSETFADASVRAADLRSDSVTQPILNKLFGDPATKLPEGLVMPDHWDDATLEYPWSDDPKFKDWLATGAPPGKPRE